MMKTPVNALKHILASNDECDTPLPHGGDGGDRSRHVQAPGEMKMRSSLRCSQCDERAAEVMCDQCKDAWCNICFEVFHRKGKRKLHTRTKLATSAAVAPSPSPDGAVAMDIAPSSSEVLSATQFQPSLPAPQFVLEAHCRPALGIVLAKGEQSEWFNTRAKAIPIRLTYEERKLLRLLEAALTCSDYTNHVDGAIMEKDLIPLSPTGSFTGGVQGATAQHGISSTSVAARRLRTQVKDVAALLQGLATGCRMKGCEQLLTEPDFGKYSESFGRLFEIGRRYKICNPDKMRSEYGKMVYILQDIASPEIAEYVGDKALLPIETVYKRLANNNCLRLLDDPALPVATSEIYGDKRNRRDVQRDIDKKNGAQDYLAKMYGSHSFSPDQVKQCIYSIADNHSFLRSNRDPVEKMIAYLNKYFSPDNVDPRYSLAISVGQGGARLSHDHARQYFYVIQSLSLWRAIAHEMFALWMLAEEDLLSSDSYRLAMTGQGIHRIQGCPRIGRAMSKILHRLQTEIGADKWIGSSVVHLGDVNVPNALMFISKYTQVSEILAPIITTLEHLEDLSDSDQHGSFVEQQGGVDEIRKLILRHAFDGSGGSNFFEAGSCIDGRLTSTWNWCSKIETKPFFPFFLLAGFTGFAGMF